MNKTLTRADLSEAIYTKVGISKVESSDIVDQIFEEMILELIDGKSVKLSSFGSFMVRDKKQRIGRNPKTKEEAVIDARDELWFLELVKSLKIRSSMIKKIINDKKKS